MEKSMDWLYFHYILPILEEENQGEYAKISKASKKFWIFPTP